MKCPKTRQCPKQQYSWQYDSRPLCKRCNHGKDKTVSVTEKALQRQQVMSE